MNSLIEAHEHIAVGVRNTHRISDKPMSEDFKLLGHGFDTVQFSFQTRVPDGLSEAIADAQRLAKAARKPEPAALGPGSVVGEVLTHGGGGGDAIFSTGELGELWYFKLDQRGDSWGVSLKIRALTLLCYGFEEAMAQCWKRARGMGLKPSGYSLGRFDYRFDIRTSTAFRLCENCLIRPARTLVQPFEVVNREHPLHDWGDPDIRRLLRGTKIETLMAGKIGSGMQVVVYDKRAEQIAAQKKALLESYGIDPADKAVGLWRVEIRYAGDVLKRRWNVRTLPALRDNLQPMLVKAATRIRYVEAGQDETHPARRTLHPLWNSIRVAITLASCNQPSQFAPERAEALMREERERTLKANITGCSLGLAAMQSDDPAQVAKLAPELAKVTVANAIVSDQEKPVDAVRRSHFVTKG